MEKKTMWQAVKYALFSVSAGVIQILSFTLLHEIIFGGQESVFWVCLARVLRLLFQ